jgi:hypothetical protein
MGRSSRRRAARAAHRQFINIRRVTPIFIACVITASCSEKPDLDGDQNGQTEEAKPSGEVAGVNRQRPNESEVERPSTLDAESSQAEGKNELKPPEDEIAEDCVAFLRSTKTASTNAANVDCPQCVATSEAREMLKFGDI